MKVPPRFSRQPALLALALALALLLPAARAAAAPSPAPFDSTHIRSITNVEPYAALAFHGRFQALDSLGLALLARTIAQPSVDSLEMAQALDAEVECAIGNGRGREAGVLAQAQRALAIHLLQPGPDSLLLARTLITVGEVQRRRRELTEALAKFRHSLAIRDRVLSPNSPDISTACRYVALADLNLELGHARAEAQRAYDISRRQAKGDDDPGLMSPLSVLAGEENLSGFKVQALKHLEQALVMSSKVYGKDHPETDRGRYNVAVMHMLVGDYVRASELYEQCINFEESRPLLDTLRITMTLGGMTECLNDLGDAEEALRRSDRVREHYLAALKATDPDYGNYQYERARALRAVGRLGEAAALYDSAMIHTSEAGGPTDSVTLILDRARVARESGNAEDALRWTSRAASLGPAALENRNYFDEYGLLRAQCLDDMGRPRDALTLLEAAEARADTVQGPRSTQKVLLLLEEARARTLLHDPLAFQAALLAADLRSEQLRAGARGFAERQALFYAREAGLGLDPLLCLAASGSLSGAQRRAALERVANSRSLVLDEICARQRLARSAHDSTSRQWLDSLFEARADLARSLVLGIPTPGGDSSLLECRRRAERLERSLATSLGRRGAEPVEFGKVLAGLGSADALVSYVEYEAPSRGARTERRVMAFVARAGASPVAVPLGTEESIESLVAEWREDVARGQHAGANLAQVEQLCRKSGAALRAAAWDPVARKLGQASRAWIVPEGPLHLVDFAALPARGRSWMVEQPLLLCRVGAERDLDSPPAAGGDRGQLLAVGGPDFEARPDPSAPVSAFRGSPLACEQFRDVRFGALPGAAQEVEDVARLWRSGGGELRVLSGSSARKSDFENLAAKASILHIATHGFFLGSGCLQGRAGSRGVGGLAPAGNRFARPSDRSAETPLRLAGLAFAGANHRAEAEPGGDDGILTGEEIASLDLTAVQDVVLSACDSGVGDVATGEGVLGLQRAFRIAGAHSLVMSLWPVEDRATRLWMSSWYRARLERGADAAAATREASRTCLAALRATGRPTPPSSWAGFVASGPGR